MFEGPLSKAHLPPQAPQRVRIEMRPHMGVVGEDRTDWFGGECHECSADFARNLVARGLAHIVSDAPASAPSVVHRDPVVENRDPVVEAGEAVSKPRPPRKSSK